MHSLTKFKIRISALTRATALMLITFVTPAAHAAAPTSALDPSRFGIVYDTPGTKQVRLVPNVPYWQDARDTLAIDIYQPPAAKRGELRPVVVFINAIGDRPDSRVKEWGIYRGWPRLVAAHGLVGVSMDANGERIQECLARAFAFLTAKGAAYGIDGARIGVYAASANVRGAWEFLGKPDAPKQVRAAALYYGNPPATAPRTDLPVLFVVAASDAPRMSADLDSLWHRVVAVGAPWTLTYGAGLPHGFDGLADNDDSRRLIQQTIAFWQSHLLPVPQPTWAHSEARDMLAVMFGSDPQAKVRVLAPWLAAHPDDPAALMPYAQALRDLRRFDEATVAFERLYALDSANVMVAAQLGTFRLNQQRWAEAVALLTRAVAAGFTDSRTLGQLGYAELGANRNEDAVRHYEQAFAAGIPAGRNTRGAASYNLACGYARVGRKQDALDALARAVDEGFGQGMADDADFASLRTEPRFRELLARVAGRGGE